MFNFPSKNVAIVFNDVLLHLKMTTLNDNLFLHLDQQLIAFLFDYITQIEKVCHDCLDKTH